MIPSPTLRTAEEDDVYWTLYNFSHYELRQYLKGGVIRLRAVIAVFLAFWLGVTGAGFLLWVLYPAWYCIFLQCFRFLLDELPNGQLIQKETETLQVVCLQCGYLFLCGTAGYMYGPVSSATAESIVHLEEDGY